MTTYIVKQGESITDVVLNSTGSIDNWDAILTANSFTSWTPDLIAGQAIIIPDTVVMDLNTLRALQTKPICNNMNDDIFRQIDDIISILKNNWILKDGVWNDKGVWIDYAVWID